MMLIFLATRCYSHISLFHDPTTISAVDRHYVFTSLAYIQEAAGTSSATRSYSHEPFRWIVCPTKARMCDWSIFMSFRDVIRKLCYLAVIAKLLFIWFYYILLWSCTIINVEMNLEFSSCSIVSMYLAVDHGCDQPRGEGAFHCRRLPKCLWKDEPCYVEAVAPWLESARRRSVSLPLSCSFIFHL